jgi:hypothetical protein
MKAIHTILVSTALMATPFISSADNSYKDVYQFGAGTPGEVVKSSNNRNSIGFAFDMYASKAYSGERAEMAVLEQGQTSRIEAKSSVPGYIGKY